MKTNLSAANWEALWSPYDQLTYAAVLQWVKPDDIVVEIGAGDLRLARLLSRQALQVYAIEIQPDLLNRELIAGRNIPRNLIPICADAREIDFPVDITIGVLLMRHCLSFQLYAQKLVDVGADRLVTNARWGMAVECIRLNGVRKAYPEIQLGWYACWCGGVGFKPGPVENITNEVMYTVQEVIKCPLC